MLSIICKRLLLPVFYFTTITYNGDTGVTLYRLAGLQNVLASNFAS